MAPRTGADPTSRPRAVTAGAALAPAAHRPIALFDTNGPWLAGGSPTPPTPLPPFDQPFDFTLKRNDGAVPFRGTMHRLPSGELLLVAQDMREAHDFRQLLTDAMVSGALVVLVVGLAGAVIMGAAALGRIDEVTRAIERIVDGDFSERLPSGGRGGNLTRLIPVVNRMWDEIQRLMDEVKGVTEDIAHDLRTPLTRLLAGLERAHRRAASAGEYAT